MEKYLIFKNEEDAINFNNKIKNLMMSNWNDGLTSDYSKVIKHQYKEEWAVVIDSKSLNYFTEIEINNSVFLSDDWFKKIL